MSQELISRSADLKRLRDEGYDIVIRSGYLLVRQVPYVNSEGEVDRGVLVSTLKLSGNVTSAPDDHVMHFQGEPPCNKDGSPIEQIYHSARPGKVLGEGVVVDHKFSSKPPNGAYGDYYEKVVAYVRILSGPAEARDPTATATVFPAVPDHDEESVLNYVDTASSRAEIMSASRKLEMGPVAIIGLGGTGSYILDLVAKTPVREIHLIDGDRFYQHNAFRSPGAPSLEELEAAPFKVDHFSEIYSRMHRGIVPHARHLSGDNLDILEKVELAFLCFNDGPKKAEAMAALLEGGVPFIDVGMGLELTADDSVTGLLRVTTVTPGKSDHMANRIPGNVPDDDDDYSTNIQVADLNALNAALAVIKWKKTRGFYLDLEREHNSTYMLNGNELINDEKA